MCIQPSLCMMNLRIFTDASPAKKYAYLLFPLDSVRSSYYALATLKNSFTKNIIDFEKIEEHYTPLNKEQTCTTVKDDCLVQITKGSGDYIRS